MAYFVKSGSVITIQRDDSFQMERKLHRGNYVVFQNSLTKQYYLEQIDDFDLPARLYGDHDKIARRVLKTFAERPHNTGILLSGEKGSGKTLLARCISVYAAENDIPTILVNKSFEGNDFGDFLSDINQEAIVFFDEFEKVFNHDQQEQFLTLFDGVYAGKKLFVISCNDFYRINQYFNNRPGRMYYSLRFDGVAPEFIREYCEAELNNKSYIDDICKLTMLYYSFNFDMLKALVEEMNRYDENPFEAVRYLNTKPDKDNQYFNVKFFVDNVEVKYLEEAQTSKHPLVVLPYTVQGTNDHDKWEKDEYNLTFTFTLDHLVSVNAALGEYTLAQDKYKVVFTKRQESKIDLLTAYQQLAI